MESRIQLAGHFHVKGYKVGAEIGVADGRYSEILCQQNPGVRLFCVDPWEAYGWRDQKYQDGAYKKACERLNDYNVRIVREPSVKASLRFKDKELDFVFVDGIHDFDYVMEDIIAWSRKVRKGGIVSLHDYYRFKDSGVIEAVNTYTQVHKIDFKVTDYYTKGHKDDRAPCAWWYVS